MAVVWQCFPVLLFVAGAGFMLLRIGQIFQRSGGSLVSQQLKYQPCALAIAICVLMLTGLVYPDMPDFLQLGDLDAQVTDLGWLGIGPEEKWSTIGLTFLVIMTMITALTLWLQVGRKGQVTFRLILIALPTAVVFSVSNAIAEELIFRLAITQALSPILAMSALALISGVMFGIPHWFGFPSKLAGVVLAGFLGWFLALSVLQTHGLGWALLLHFAQDVVIFAMLIAADPRKT